MRLTIVLVLGMGGVGCHSILPLAAPPGDGGAGDRSVGDLNLDFTDASQDLSPDMPQADGPKPDGPVLDLPVVLDGADGPTPMDTVPPNPDIGSIDGPTLMDTAPPNPDIGSLDGPTPMDTVPPNPDIGSDGPTPMETAPPPPPDGPVIDAAVVDTAPPEPDLPQPDTQSSKDLASPDVATVPPMILATHDNYLLALSTTGASLTTPKAIPYPVPRPGTEEARDLVGLSGQKVAIYNGTFAPYLTVYDSTSVTTQWAHHSAGNWSTESVVSYGGLTTWGSFVYATDMSTGTMDTTTGIVRFETNAWSSTHYDSLAFIDVNLGLDGHLYALASDEKTVTVFNPSTMAWITTIVLPVPAHALAVNAKSEIFVATWSGNLHRIVSNQVVGTHATLKNNLVDIDLGYGYLVASSRFGAVVVTNEAFSSASSFSVGTKPVFITLVAGP